MRRIYVFFRDAFLAYKALYAWLRWEVFLLLKVVQPAVELVFFVMVVQYMGGGNLENAMIGNAFRLATVSGIMGIIVMFRMERAYGTLRTLIGTPSNRYAVFLGRSVFQVLDGFLSIVFGLLVAALVWGFDPARFHLGSMLLLALIASWSVSSVGLLAGSAGLVMRDINMVLNVVYGLFILLTGINFPVDRLPAVLQAVSEVLPLTHVVEAARELYAGAGWPEILPLVGKELLIGLVFYGISVLTFGYLERKMVKHSTYDLI